MKISSAYFELAMGEKPTDVQLETCNNGGWCWEKNQPSENGETDYKTRYAYLLAPLYTLQADGPRNVRWGICGNIADSGITAYDTLEAIFCLMGYEDTVYPIGANRGDRWSDGRRMRLVQQLINFCEGKDYEHIS